MSMIEVFSLFFFNEVPLVFGTTVRLKIDNTYYYENRLKNIHDLLEIKCANLLSF